MFVLNIGTTFKLTNWFLLHRNYYSQVGHYLVERFGATNDFVWNILDACRTVEKLVTIEAIYISKLKPVLKRDEYRGRKLTLKY